MIKPRPLKFLALSATLLGVGMGLGAGCPVLPSYTDTGYPFADISDTFGEAMEEHHLTRDFCDHVERSAPPGVCMFDYDSDGDVDLFTTDLEGRPNRLYANQGEKLVEVSAEVGLDEVFDSIGCLAFDYDGDGDLDLLVTNNGPDQLYRNDEGVFANITEASGLDVGLFSTSAAAGDIDGDGDLDLVIGRFVDKDSCDNGCVSSPHPCTPYSDVLLENRDGIFVDVSEERGIVHESQTLATLFFDPDRDGDLDLYIGSDSGYFFPDRMYVNDGTGTFLDSEEMGLGHNEAATMGVAIGDVDGNGVSDLAITDFMGFASPLYLCEMPGPTCSETVIEWESFRTVRFNIALQDFDGDGDLDVFQTTGNVVSTSAGGSHNFLGWNDGTGVFETHVPEKDDPLDRADVSRGAVVGDLDNDGDPDLVIVNVAGRPQILRNDVFSGNFVGVELDSLAAGARVRVDTDDRSQFRDVVVGTGFLGSNDPRLYFGVGEARTASVTVEWLDGSTTVIDAAETNRMHTPTRP